MQNADSLSEEQRSELERIVVYAKPPEVGVDPFSVEWCVVYIDSTGKLYTSSEVPTQAEIAEKVKSYHFHARDASDKSSFPNDRRKHER